MSPARARTRAILAPLLSAEHIALTAARRAAKLKATIRTKGLNNGK